MKVLNQLDIAHEFCQLLLQYETGTRDKLAQTLGISARWVSVYKHKIENLYKVQIHYCRKKQSYYVSKEDIDRLPPRLFRMNLNCIFFQKELWVS